MPDDLHPSCEFAVIGGGLVGAAIGFGLAAQGRDVAVLDEGDVAFRASRGNFGLVWVQSKGQGNPAYGQWTLRSAQAWPRLADSLQALTGIDVQLEQRGGLSVFLSEREAEARIAAMQRMLAQPGMPRYDWRVLDRAELRDHLPGTGPGVVGALHCRHDGHVNALKLLHALHRALVGKGARYLAQRKVLRIRPHAGGFVIETERGALRAQQVVLAAGLGNASLAPQLGLHAPVRAQRGQIIALERLRPLLKLPLATLRQTDEGTVLIGDSQEECGDRVDDAVGLPVLATMAERAVRMLPALKDARVVRSWAALRVMSPDGFPIYDQSQRWPGAFVVTCHSGVTLAAVHAFDLAAAIGRGSLDAMPGAFSSRRFDVPAPA